jgi:nitroreductase
MDFTEVASSRRSVHQYDDRDIDDDTVESIFETVRYAPSSYNLQPWEFLLVRDDENLERLREVANDQAHVTDAAATVVVLGNTDPSAHADAVLDDWVHKGYLPNEDVRDAVLENVEAMAEWPETERRLWTTKSSTLAAMTLMDAAWNEGVASCPMGGFDADALVEEFDVDDGYEPVMLVTLGYPEDDADDVENPRKYRRPVDEILHYEEFDPVESTDLPDEQTEATPVADD